MPEKIITLTDEELARMFKSGEMRLLTSPADETQTILPEQILGSDLLSEWDKQANRLADLFAKELSLSRDQYINGLPCFFPQPPSYKDRFDTPLIVQTPTEKLTLTRILEIAEVGNYLDSKNVNDWEEDPGNFKTPEVPYITWLHDGSRNIGRSVTKIRKNLAQDERGGAVLDGLALFIQNPDILRSHYLDLPGSQYGFDNAPDLRLWHDGPGLNGSFVDGADSKWGSVVAGRNIGT